MYKTRPPSPKLQTAKAKAVFSQQAESTTDQAISNKLVPHTFMKGTRQSRCSRCAVPWGLVGGLSCPMRCVIVICVRRVVWGASGVAARWGLAGCPLFGWRIVALCRGDLWLGCPVGRV